MRTAEEIMNKILGADNLEKRCATKPNSHYKCTLGEIQKCMKEYTTQLLEEAEKRIIGRIPSVNDEPNMWEPKDCLYIASGVILELIREIK